MKKRQTKKRRKKGQKVYGQSSQYWSEGMLPIIHAAACINKALLELEERRSQIGSEAMAIDDKLEVIRLKKERLGLAFADGAVSENSYKSKLNQLKKQEAALFKSRTI